MGRTTARNLWTESSGCGAERKAAAALSLAETMFLAATRISWLNVLHPLNTKHILVVLEISQDEVSWLNDYAPSNMLLISVTDEVF